jgi:hypothetical protein
MRVLVQSIYAQTEGRTALDLFMSPETPKRPADAKEIASFTYGDHQGVHVMFLFDVEDAKLADFIHAQTARTIYMSSRADVKIAVHIGHSVQEAMSIAMKHLPEA